MARHPCSELYKGLSQRITAASTFLGKFDAYDQLTSSRPFCYSYCYICTSGTHQALTVVIFRMGVSELVETESFLAASGPPGVRVS
ncbi:hypothetical protein M404DRAFT_1007374 [Pisolithus tinctorius Marx 270]|uniref:Uncharacterized protein n=1 Tax=Pisolithus tinctorius Marx 270 TaxID=870435 RepID=A0A0C3NIS1_PISTI|nr:hypothetical protein M404DRAFT_1007374 [Pisolithus tinctorius Marx 270]